MSEWKKGCELCSINPATMLCESDQASLCWDCDEKVHAANFLVAKHSRSLLCDVCQSPTPWSAAGPNLGRTVSVCAACAPNSDHDTESDSTEYDSHEESESESESESEDGENQVVPWSDFAPPRTHVSPSNTSPTREMANSKSQDEDGSWTSENYL